MKRILLFMIFIFMAGCLFADEREDRIIALPEAYRELGRGCLQAISFNCCMSSVDNMVRVRAILRESGQDCPEGYRGDMLLCKGAYAWCEPVVETPGEVK